MNYVTIVGRIVNDLILESNDNKEYVNITIAVPRSFKNMEGEYDTDFIDITAYGNIAKSTKEYVEKGDIIGVKGRIARLRQDKEMNIIAGKITWLKSSRKDEENDI